MGTDVLWCAMGTDVLWCAVGTDVPPGGQAWNDEMARRQKGWDTLAAREVEGWVHTVLCSQHMLRAVVGEYTVLYTG